MSQKFEVPTWGINDVKLELDLEDVEVMEKYEEAITKMAEEEKSLPKDGTKSMRIKCYCEMFYHLYDNLFGPGTAAKIFNGRYNARMCDETYDSFLAFVSENSLMAKTRRTDLVQKYLGNRKQRRSKERA